MINKLPSKHLNNNKSTNKNKTFKLITANIKSPNFFTLPSSTKNRQTVYLDKNNCAKNLYTSEELKLLRLSGHQITKQHITYHTSNNNLFTDFIIYLHKLKHKNPKLSKFLLNSFYGKLASNTHTNYLRPSVLNPLLTNQHNTTSQKLEKDRNSLLLAGTITSYARIMSIKSLSSASNPSIYTDTDSIMCQHPTTYHISSSKIGHLKHVSYKHNKKFFIDKIEFKSPKSYIYKQHKCGITKKGNKMYEKSHSSINKTNLIQINNKPIDSIFTIELI